jgi:LicD family
MLPWDWDLDVQVSADTLNLMGEKYNMTTHSYVSEDGDVSREYLLDVNPWIWQRVRGDGYNIIDARWIDVRNGLYIDITGLAETKPDTEPGILTCKNLHRYHVGVLASSIRTA